MSTDVIPVLPHSPPMKLKKQSQQRIIWRVKQGFLGAGLASSTSLVPKPEFLRLPPQSPLTNNQTNPLIPHSSRRLPRHSFRATAGQEAHFSSFPDQDTQSCSIFNHSNSLIRILPFFVAFCSKSLMDALCLRLGTEDQGDLVFRDLSRFFAIFRDNFKGGRAYASITHESLIN
jgi:hypothetical protein